MGNENTTPEKMKDIEMALKDISTVYSVGFWREKCRRLFADRQALMKENQRLQSELEEYTKANWAAQGREEKLVEALRKIYRRTQDPNKPCRGDVALIAHDTLKELGIE